MRKRRRNILGELGVSAEESKQTLEVCQYEYRGEDPVEFWRRRFYAMEAAYEVLEGNFQELQQTPRWQPIETAPRGDRDPRRSMPECVLLAMPSLRVRFAPIRVTVGYWDEYGECWRDHEGERVSAGGAMVPTHWMPVPTNYSTAGLRDPLGAEDAGIDYPMVPEDDVGEDQSEPRPPEHLRARSRVRPTVMDFTEVDEEPEDPNQSDVLLEIMFDDMAGIDHPEDDEEDEDELVPDEPPIRDRRRRPQAPRLTDDDYSEEWENEK